jgi:hypothetical protein
MPEAAVHEDNHSLAGPAEIRPTSQVIPVAPPPGEAIAAEEFGKSDFSCPIPFSSDRAHYARARGRRGQWNGRHRPIRKWEYAGGSPRTFLA